MTVNELEGGMFSSNTECAEADIPSRWREFIRKEGQDATIQTQPITTADKAEQSPSRSDIKIQTETRQETVISADYDEQALAEFLYNDHPIR